MSITAVNVPSAPTTAGTLLTITFETATPLLFGATVPVTTS